MSNEEPKFIPLSQRNFKGKYAIVDAEDYVRINQFRWSHADGYAVRCIAVGCYTDPEKRGNRIWKTIKMEQEVMGTCAPIRIDHKDGNRSNNCKSNLRIATQAENNINMPIRTTPGKTSKYKGVSWQKNINKWYSYVNFNGVRTSAGYFDDEKEAALARDALALTLHGEFVRLNLPEGTV